MYICQEYSNSVLYLHGIVIAEIHLLLDLLLQEVDGLGLLHTRAGRLIATVVAGRICLEELRADLVVDRDQDHRATERSHLGILCVHLVDVGDALAQQLDRYVVIVLVLEALRLINGSLHLRAAVGCEICQTVYAIKFK